MIRIQSGRALSCAAAILLLTAVEGWGVVRYVKWDAVGLNDGTSWADAYTDLQSALSVAVSGDEVWVAAGTYKPIARTNSSDPRSATFQLVGGVRLFGGFVGTETSRTQCHAPSTATVLSGDLNGNDGANFTNYDENSYHVVLVTNVNDAIELNGFTISHGNAWPGPNNYGGGLCAAYSNLRIKHCVFRDNKGDYGAAWVSTSGTITLDLCSFNNNQGAQGGAMYLNGGEPLIAKNCTFRKNVSSTTGGAIHIYNMGDIRFYNCVYSGNSAANYGGAISAYKLYSSLDAYFINCTVYANTANNAGGIYAENGARTWVYNSIFWNNTDRTGTGGLAQVIAREIAYSCIQGAPDHQSNVTNRDPLFVNASGPDGIAGTEDDDYRLLNGSPCIDSARNSYIPADSTDLDCDGNTAEQLPLDFYGVPRFVDDPATTDTGSGMAPIVDIGAYEYQGLPCNTPKMDANGDQHVDAIDFDAFSACYNGPTNKISGDCLCLDANSDQYVDAVDFDTFSGCYNGPTNPPRCGE